MAARRLRMPLSVRSGTAHLATRAPYLQPNTLLAAPAITQSCALNGVFPRRYATSPGRVPAKDSWGKADISGINEKDLARYKRKWPDLMRYEPSQYMDAAQMFAALSEKNGHDWPLRVKQAYRPSKEMLNDLGCYLSEMSDPGKNRFAETAVACFAGASALGCEISTISVMTIVSGSNRASLLYRTALFAPIVKRFREIVSKGQNPYALKLEGKMLLNEGKFNAAIRILERAAQLLEPSSKWWAATHHLLGLAYRNLDHTEEALECFELAAAAGNPEAWNALIDVPEMEPEERAQFAYKSGCAGNVGDFFWVSTYQDYLARGEGLSRAERVELIELATEYKRLADTEAPY